MTPTLVIETMTGRHLDAVRAIDTACYSAPWSVAMWRSELKDDNRCHLVAREDDRVVGHAGTLQVVDELHVTTVAVDPDCQGRGIASRLVLSLLERARTEGSATAATLEVRAADRRTQRLYARFGFVPAGVRPGYYAAPSDDGVVMWLDELGSDNTAVRLSAVAEALGAEEGTE